MQVIGTRWKRVGSGNRMLGGTALLRHFGE
jgi:hypothetical protein